MLKYISVIFVLKIFYALNSFCQLSEHTFYFTKYDKECKKTDTAYKRIDIKKKIYNTYIISYFYHYHNDWCTDWNERKYYDELKIDCLNTGYTLKRTYKVCCGAPDFSDLKNKKKIIALKLKKNYLIQIFDKNDNLLQQGKSLYNFPLVWNDTLLYFSENKKLYKKEIYDHGKITNKILYNTNGIKIDSIIPFEFLDTKPKFKNSNNDFEDDIKIFLRYYNYPKKALENFVMGKVYIYFLISNTGKIEHPQQVLYKPILGEYCIDLIKSLPEIIPGKLNGKNVYTFYTHTFYFNID